MPDVDAGHVPHEGGVNEGGVNESACGYRFMMLLIVAYKSSGAFDF